MRRLITLAGVPLFAVLTLTGCSPPAADPVSTASTEPTDTPADATSTVQTAVGDTLAPLVLAATRTPAGRIEVTTSLIDPRSDGSQEGLDAVAICETLAALEGVTYVNVLEVDGTTFAVFGHPSFPRGKCSEV